MKRYCKKVDIGNALFIQTCVHECLRKRCKRLRPDTLRLFAEVGGLCKADAHLVLDERGPVYDFVVGRIARGMAAAGGEFSWLAGACVMLQVYGARGRARGGEEDL